jgi:hypothetical protein
VPIELAGYREWKGELRPPRGACWPIMRTGLWLVLRRKIFWPLLALGLFNFLFAFAVVYIKAQLTAQGMPVGRFMDQVMLTGTGRAYQDFMFAQSLALMLLLAFAGSMLVGGDYQQSGLTFYLSRRIDKRHYIAGKLLAIGGVVSLITAVPALLLYLEYGLFSSSLDYFRENPRIIAGILGYGAIMAVTFSLVLAAIASWVPRTVPLVMTWAGIFVLLPALGESIGQMRDEPRWALLDLPRDLYVLGSKCFGALEAGTDDARLADAAMWAVPAVCVVCLLSLVRRVRAVEVVR